MTRLILVRHGQTDWNLEGRWQGQSDVPLNDNGRLQARQVGETFAGQSLDAVYSSDLSRARDTAAALADATGAPLIEDARLREIDLGDWEGRHLDDIQAADGARLAEFRARPAAQRAPGGEGPADVQRRALAVVDEIARRHPDGRVAIVAHGLTLAVLRLHLLGLPLDQVWDNEPGNAEPEEHRLEVR